MWFYLLLLFFIICISARYSINGVRVNPNTKLALGFVLIGCVAVFRFKVGIDYCSYWNAIWPKITHELNRWELIPRCMGYIAYYVKCPQLFFILIGVPTYYFFYLGIKENSSAFYESLIIFFAVFFLDTMTFARSMLAVAVLFWASKFVFHRQFFKYLIVCIICFFIHRASLVTLFIYFLYNYIDWRISLLGVIGLICGQKFFIAKLGLLGIYAGYLESLGSLSGGNSVRLFYILITVVLVVIALVCHNFTRHVKKLMSVIIAGICFPFVFGSHLGMRMGTFFFTYICFAYPLAFRKVHINKRAVTLAGFYLYFVLLLWTSVKTHPTNSPYTPYQTIFFADEKDYDRKLTRDRR